jgi:aryl-alcohol dehydrogenase-like predicted oxidoreductase
VTGGSDVSAASGGSKPRHRFRAIQLPINLAMPEALGLQNQVVNGQKMTILQAAWESGVAVFASGSLLQARLTHGMPANIASRFDPSLTTDAARALQFVRSVPGVATALVGMGQKAHALENMRLAAVAPFTEPEFAAAFG